MLSQEHPHWAGEIVTNHRGNFYQAFLSPKEDGLEKLLKKTRVCMQGFYTNRDFVISSHKHS